ncbi:PulJ/GspJ family protein [Cellulomonas edaphi]|uniref:Type II secretion system protein n=1 Tax=Cellulomonas edaphi TaxID=3053468 RepID=A0ABT7S6H8_9CELL|nr:type II secretion system protein [Cellulomons edaphi]MDM7831226.1 type II secretion system protein [Cellulomons edaphi]
MRLDHARGDRGNSLTEMLIVMLIFGVILAAVGTLTMGFTRSNSQNVSRQTQVESARMASETMSKYLRTAVMPSQLTSACTNCQDAFVLGQDFAVQFYANIDNPGNSVGPSQVTYTVVQSGASAGDLVEKVQIPDSNVPTSTGYIYCNAEAGTASPACKARLRTRTVAKGVQVAAGAPVFTYYRKNGQRMTPTAGSLTTDDLSKVLAVELTVSVQSGKSYTVDPTTYVQRVTLPNAQAVLRQEAEN